MNTTAVREEDYRIEKDSIGTKDVPNIMVYSH